MKQGVILQNYDRLNNINRDIELRNKTNAVMQPNLSFRPTSTKYAIFPIFSSLEKPLEQEYPVYNQTNHFYPGNSKPHFSGFATNVDIETNLQNRIYALQRDSRAVYIPASTSSLYNNYNVINDINNNISNGLMFNEEHFNPHNPNDINVGNDTFHNSTRIQLKNQ